MKIKVEGHELVDPEIQAVSLVKRGANRTPFKIVKSDDHSQAANPRVILHVEPDNGGVLGTPVDPRYPLGRPAPLFKRGSGLDGLVADAAARVFGRK